MRDKSYIKHRKQSLPVRVTEVTAETAETASVKKPWTVSALCQAYEWPKNLAGGGVIGIVELGGGWTHSDINEFFASEGMPVPSITDVSVDGTKNTPNPDPQGADYEVALDIEVAGVSYHEATGKVAVIRVYWSQNIVTAIERASKDGCDICSISWGADETSWGKAEAEILESAVSSAVAGGMIVLAAAGDNDSSDGGRGSRNVDLPASSPHVIGCGGTSKTSLTETVWNNDPGNPDGEGTGGGYSKFFALQSWQIGAPFGPGRMVPDVSANADPDTGYIIVVHGSQTVVGGTSAVAPLYAGLFAAFGKKLGWISPKLWVDQVAFNDITSGNNGSFRARVGPDPCTGLGSPIGTALSKLLVK